MLKRLVDILIASLGLLVLSPFGLLIAIAIKLDSAGPVFFRQERVGRGGVPFRIFKFRTMRPVSGAHLQITVDGDQRITRVGALLRRTKIDELPQLIDVLRGTMSLVGPRPEVPKYVAHYPPAWRERLLSVRPGITDFASVHFRRESELLAESPDPENTYIEDVLPQKLKYALHYVDNPSLRNDLKVIRITLGIVVEPLFEGAKRAMRIEDIEFWVRIEHLLSRLGRWNRRVALAIDAAIVLVCWHLTYLFRLGFERWQPGRPSYDDYVAFAVVICYSLSLSMVGVPRGLWRFFGFDDFRRIIVGCLLAGLISACAVLMLQLVGVARAVLVLHPLFCVFAMSIVRMGYRLLWEHASHRATGGASEPRRALVLGAGERARQLVSSMHRQHGWSVLALLDDDVATHGLRIAGVDVIGGVAELRMPHVLAGATHIVIALDRTEPDEVERIAELARSTGLTVLRMGPSLSLNPDSPS